MDDIGEIVSSIDEILRHRSEPIDKLGSRIVGATIVSDGIEKHYADYPSLERLAELGADLETLGDSTFASAVLAEIKSELEKLKLAIHD